jgi:acetyl-CoA carboxylase biotin carboxylase subunit
MITGLDLVAQMFRIAGGEPLALRQEDIAVHGHSIEVRINAEDPAQNFRPWPGQVVDLKVPQGPEIRFDTMLYAGYTVPPFYDSLLGKLVVHGETREDCLDTLRRALDELKITGLPTTLPLHQALVRDAGVVAGAFHTRFLEAWLTTDFPAKAAQSKEIA